MTSLPATFVPGFHDEEVVRKIPYQKLGQTDMIVSRLSFGCSSVSQCIAFTADGQVVPGDPQLTSVIKLIHSAAKSGINYFDTSPFYGAGKSEIVLGHALTGLPRSSFYVATKVGRNETCQFDYSPHEVRRLVQNSLRKLQVEYIDLVQVHDVEFADSIETIVNETLPELEQLRKEGLIRYIGITGYPLDVLKQVIEQNASSSSPVRIDTVLSYCRLTLFNTDLLKYTDFFREHKLGIINAAVHGMGLLTGGNIPDWHPAKPSLRSACQAAIHLCRQESADICRLVTANALSSTDADTVLTGMMTEEILQTNMNVLINGLNEKEKMLLDRVRRECMSSIADSEWEGVELDQVKADRDKFCHTLRKLHGEA
jgi:aryl-alcohol dehydrogenase-like predicted oxidoreductase